MDDNLETRKKAARRRADLLYEAYRKATTQKDRDRLALASITAEIEADTGDTRGPVTHRVVNGKLERIR